jgi:hypothetical protein
MFAGAAPPLASICGSASAIELTSAWFSTPLASSSLISWSRVVTPAASAWLITPFSTRTATSGSGPDCAAAADAKANAATAAPSANQPRLDIVAPLARMAVERRLAHPYKENERRM